MTCQPIGPQHEYACSHCGSTRLTVVEGEYPTGVASPDGGKEYRHYEAVKCLDCGLQEEL